MSQESARARSPNSPKIPLSEALKQTEALYKKAGRSPIKAEIAASALGYSGLTGSSMSLLGALNQYSLIDRTKGDVQVTALAVRIIHAVSAEDKLAALREAALAPKVFNEIHEKYRDMAEDLLANQLVHMQFDISSARRVAAAYKANVELAKLGEASVTPGVKTSDEPDKRQSATLPPQVAPLPKTGHSPQPIANAGAPQNMIASFKIPLPLAEAEFIFTGEKLEADDFDALLDYIELFKKQYLRKQALKKVDGQNDRTAGATGEPIG